MVRTTSKKAGTADRRKAGAAKTKQPVQSTEAAVEGICDENVRVVTQLAERAICGNKDSFDYLNSRSSTAQDGNDTPDTPQGSSQAALWMSEPEWNGESSEETMEISAASREPE